MHIMQFESIHVHWRINPIRLESGVIVKRMSEKPARRVEDHVDGRTGAAFPPASREKGGKLFQPRSRLAHVVVECSQYGCLSVDHGDRIRAWWRVRFSYASPKDRLLISSVCANEHRLRRGA